MASVIGFVVVCITSMVQMQVWLFVSQSKDNEVSFISVLTELSNEGHSSSIRTKYMHNNVVSKVGKFVKGVMKRYAVVRLNGQSPSIPKIAPFTTRTSPSLVMLFARRRSCKAKSTPCARYK